VVCAPLVVHEGLPGGTRVTSIISQKLGFTGFQFMYQALFLKNKFSYSRYSYCIVTLWLSMCW